MLNYPLKLPIFRRAVVCSIYIPILSFTYCTIPNDNKSNVFKGNFLKTQWDMFVGGGKKTNMLHTSVRKGDCKPPSLPRAEHRKKNS